MEQKVVFSDLTQAMITDPARRVQVNVLEHPDADFQPVQLDVMPEEIATLGKLAIDPVVCEVVVPPTDGQEEPQVNRYVLARANFDKLASKERPMRDVLAEATPYRVPKAAGRTAVRGEQEQRDHNSLEWAGTPHKGKTSPLEAQLVRDNLEAINARLTAQGYRTIDPANPEHARRYGFGAESAAQAGQDALPIENA